MTHDKLELGLEQDADGITTLTLVPNPTNERGGVVVLDDWLLGQLELALDKIESGPTPSGLILASGHYRNGILLTPATAEWVGAALETA